MTTVTLQQAFEDCLNNKTAWLTRRQELADTEQEYRELIATGNDSRVRSLQTLRDIIDVKSGKLIRRPVAIFAHMRTCSASVSVTG